MASSAKFFHFDNKPSTPSWAKTSKKEGEYTDWFTEKLEDGLFQQYDRQDPTEPLEGKDFVESEPSEPYDPSKHTHPILAVAGAYGSTAKAVENAPEAIKEVVNKVVSNDSSGSSGFSAKPIIYSDWSPASKLMGMSQDTAFAEHLANTAHQREVADLKAAGLNPVLGISGSGSSVVSGNSAIGASSAEKVEQFPWMDVLGATAGLVTTVVTKKPALGYMVANVFKAFDK